MCGICGFFQTGGAGQAVEVRRVLSKMQDAIRHRGPDGDGQWISSHAALGHVRLAILDVKGGAQPMVSEDGRYVISYNGELYNFKQIRSELEGSGWRFRTRSDTEVVLNAWAMWSVESLQRFNGIYAFSIWDSLEREGFLVRDPFGVKPLFFCQQARTLYFASEAKAIVRALPYDAKLDLASVHMLMNFRYLPGEMTLWKGIRQLRPGHLLRWSPTGVTQQKWMEIGGTYGNGDQDYYDVLRKTRAFVKVAIERQLVSDVGIGGYLSSGIDSGIITAVASKALQLEGRDYPTFTIKTGDSPIEAIGAAETARHLGVANFQEDLEVDMFHWLRWLILHTETPKVNALQSAVVARLASGHVKVALSGLGGDEVFLGYNIHSLFQRLWVRFRNGSFLLRPLVLGLKQMIKPLGLHADELLRGLEFLGTADEVTAYGMLRNFWHGYIDKDLIYGPRMLDVGDFPSPFDYVRDVWPRGRAHAPLKRLQLFEMREKMVNDLLWNEDRVSMGRGLEVRVPFLDQDLVQFALRLDLEDLMSKGRLKGLLKDVGQTWLPLEVLGRPKSGFQVPIHIFFDQHLRGLCGDCLTEERVARDGLFNYDFIKRVMEARPGRNLRWHYFMLYLMLGMTIWLDIFERKEVPAWADPAP